MARSAIDRCMMKLEHGGQVVYASCEADYRSAVAAVAAVGYACYLLAEWPCRSVDGEQHAAHS